MKRAACSCQLVLHPHFSHRRRMPTSSISITGASRSSGRAVPCDAADVRNPHHCCYTTSAPFESSHRLPVYVSPLYGTAGTTAKRDVVMQRDPGLQSEDIRRCSSFRRALVRPFSHRAVTALIFTCTLVACKFSSVKWNEGMTF